MSWREVGMTEVAQLIMGQSPKSTTYNETGDGLPFFQGKSEFGTKHPVAKKYCSDPVKVAEPYDVLLSVRAPVGAVNIAERTCCIGRGLAAIRPIPAKLDYLYLYYFLKFRQRELQGLGVGSTFEAIAKRDIENLTINIPDSLREQAQIASALSEADSLIQKRKQAIAKLDDLVQSVFLDMFGDPVANPKNWIIKKLADVGILGRGVSKHRPRNDPALLGGPYPLIQTGDVANSGLYLEAYKSTYSEIGLKQSKLWKKGTLCITIAANIADACILSFDACFPDSVVGFLPDKDLLTNEYLFFWLGYLKKIIETNAPQSAQKNINLAILSELEVILPPKDLIWRFTSIVREVESKKRDMKMQLEKLEGNFACLLYQAFTGQLQFREDKVSEYAAKC